MTKISPKNKRFRCSSKVLEICLAGKKVIIVLSHIKMIELSGDYVQINFDNGLNFYTKGLDSEKVYDRLLELLK